MGAVGVGTNIHKYGNIILKWAALGHKIIHKYGNIILKWAVQFHKIIHKYGKYTAG